MIIVSLIQGSKEWLEHRRKFLNASDAPAMMGCSSYKTRSELVKELATGLGQEVDVATQRRFDDGHRFEALARPLAEEIIGEDLSPCVGTNGKFSASFDGLTFMHDVALEHKTLNKALREAMVDGRTGEDLPLQYRVQMEQQAMVSGCERILFMASEWTGDGQLIEARHCWYYPDPELRAQIIAGWEQLEKDVAAYDPAAERPAQAVAAPMESLPAVVVQVQGALTVTGNLDAFGDALRQFIGRMPTKPATDQDFADLEAGSKALKKVEDALDAAEDGALAQISPVEQMRRIKADLKNLARTTRLVWDKLVSAEKDRLRTALVTGAQAQLDQHIQALNRRLGSNWLPRMAGGFGEVIKGKKSLANMEDAVAVALTSAKHEANVLADRLEANRKHLVQADGDWIALFADFATVGAKAEEDFQILAAHRIGQHKQAEARRLEAERERIRAEEAAKLQAQAAINAAAATQKEAASAQQEPFSAAPAAETKVQSAQAAPEVAAKAEGETLTLGQLNTILAPIKVDTAGLADLGFEARKVEKSTAKHYAACDLPAMVQAMIAHLQSVLVTA